MGWFRKKKPVEEEHYSVWKEDFSDWNHIDWSEPGTYFEHGWRFFSVQNASARLELVTLPEGNILRLTRDNEDGDAGLDKDTN